MTDTSPSNRRPDGPPLGILAIVTLALTVAGVAVLVAGTGSAPAPLASPAQVAAWYATAPVAIRVGALLQCGAAVPLGILTATVYARQLRLGVRVPGPVIGLYGGIAASLSLSISALLMWAASYPADESVVAAFARLSFALGGVGYATGIGLLIAGIAVPGLILRLLPRWLTITGLVLGALGELSFLSLVLDPVQAVLPVVRFGGGVWLIVMAFLLPSKRPRRSAPAAGAMPDRALR